MIGTVRTVLLYSTTALFGVIFSGIFLAEAITMLDIVSLALVLGGIYMLRNKLAATEEHGPEEEEQVSEHTTPPRRTKSRKRAKFTPKISVRKRIEDEVIFQGWIGAG